MEIAVIYVIKLLLLPPASLLLMALAGLLMRKHDWGLPLSGISIVLLIVLSLPATAGFLAETLETDPVLTPKKITGFRPQAIVVIGGGGLSGNEYQQGWTVNPPTLVRLRYAAKLARDTGLPILVSGGKASKEEKHSEAQNMTDILQKEFNVPVTWQEEESRTTAENALYSRKILQAAAVDKILLVTQAYHMRRAAWAFRNVGFEVLPAPTAFVKDTTPGALNFIPSAKGMERSFLVCHEYLGLFWYRWF
jgi:uncharacterized SAM-binding protein YcdF (DUF218 family)